MSPVLAHRKEEKLDLASENLFCDIDEARVPIQYLARLFGVGNESKLCYALRKQKAVRWYRRAVTVGDVDMPTAERMLQEADCTTAEAQAIYHMTAICPENERYVIPPAHREEAAELLDDSALYRKQSAGFGFLSAPKRG